MSVALDATMPVPAVDSRSDQELIQAIQLGAQSLKEAMASLYQEHQGMIRNLVIQYGGTPDEAKDVLHEGIIRLIESILQGQFRGKSSLATYLYTICRNYWLSHLKQAGRWQEEFPQEETIDLSLSPLDQADRAVHRDLAQEILGKLGKPCQQLLIWTSGEGRPMLEVAKTLGYKDRNSAMVQKTKCKWKLLDLVRKNPTYKRLVFELFNYIY